MKANCFFEQVLRENKQILRQRKLPFQKVLIAKSLFTKGSAKIFYDLTE